MTSIQPVFVVGTTEVTDPTTFDQYVERVAGTIERYGGRICLAGHSTVLEGDTSPTVAAVIEFPDAISAATWYDSPEYSEIRPLRQASGTSTVVLLEPMEASRSAGAANQSSTKGDRQ